jgi:dihydrofolate reductase
MSKIVVWMQMSLDGKTQGPSGEFDWPVVRDELNGYFVDQLRSAGMFLYGRKVYEMMAYFWPTADQDPGGHPDQIAYSKIWKPMPKLVFSGTLRDAQWNTTVLDDVDQRVRDHRDAARGDLYLFGGSRIVGEFARQDLVDEYQVFVHPVALGGGAPLFPSPAQRQGFSLRESRVFDDTVVGLRYARARA